MSMYENIGMTSLDYINEIQRLQADVAKLTVENEKLLNKIAKIQFELDDVVNEWVSVNDRMPEEGVDVLVYGRVYAERNGIDVDYVDENGDFYYYDKNVTHWMPLPEPPKE